jgi:hypothetical protein
MVSGLQTAEITINHYLRRRRRRRNKRKTGRGT